MCHAETPPVFKTLREEVSFEKRKRRRGCQKELGPLSISGQGLDLEDQKWILN